VVQVGDDIQVYVLELDQDHQRIALSLRRTQSDPWEIVNNSYEIGDVVEGTVSNVVDFGAFVVLDDGIEGLLHITEMADGTLTEPHSYVKRGDKVTVKIVRIEPERKRIGFTQAGLNMTRPTDEPSESVATDQPMAEAEAGSAEAEATSDQPDVESSKDQMDDPYADYEDDEFDEEDGELED
jgi:small subunit ribosomal protein S1